MPESVLEDAIRHGRLAAAALPSSGLPFRQLLEKLPAGAYVCDGAGLITYFNLEAARLWGREPKLGDSGQRFCGSYRLRSPDGEPLAHEQCPMADVLRSGIEVDGREVVIEREDGSQVTALVHITPLLGAEGQVVGAVNVLVDITERKAAERALAERERDLQDFFENAPIGLHWVNAEGTILRVNQAELDMLGYARDEFVGRDIREFHVDQGALEAVMRRLLDGETVRNAEVRMRCKDGREKLVSVSTNAQWEAGRFVHTRCFLRDVTAQRRFEQALTEEHRRKDEFLATLAHELRNPLAPLRNGLEALDMSAPGDPLLQRLHALMDRQVRQLVRLVDDLLEVSRITRGKVELKQEPARLDEILASAVETSRPMIDAAGQVLDVDLPDPPPVLHADPLRLAQVFANLLNNAAKYSGPGSRIGIVARVVEREVELVVRDEGVGMPPELLARAFDMFSQGDHSLDRAQGGLGIGLTLVKSLVELHGGRVRAHSEGPGRGSAFVVRLPLASPGQAVAASGAPAMAPPLARRVLVVDDNRDAADSLVILLGTLGVDCRAAYGGESGLAAIRSFRPDFVLLDIGMPGMDGYELLRRARQEPELDPVRFVALTGWGQEDDRRRSLAAGCVGHLVKPVGLGELTSLLSAPPPPPHAGARGR